MSMTMLIHRIQKVSLETDFWTPDDRPPYVSQTLKLDTEEGTVSITLFRSADARMAPMITDVSSV